MSYVIKFLKQAQKDIAYFEKSGNRKSYDKIRQITCELMEHPYTGTGKPELLKYDKSGYWSRRINKADRLIYYVEENIITVCVVSARGHYYEK
ncbi:MAG: Txe/YoeB family addiction module toxin [Prevotellaceae bacterium]|jgi:toxin YoeB|nr:Txe/YoeB family addiction module toxin [Prevotellaceae bacterium]